MINQPWSELQEAFQKFLKQRQNGQMKPICFLSFNFSQLHEFHLRDNLSLN